MAVIAITGRKGGIGKSTITGNLAAEFADLGYSVAVLDTDSQKSLTKWASLGNGLLAAITTPVETTHPEQFKRAVEHARASAKVVLVDTPPAFADPALLATLVADIVLIPCGPSPLDIMEAGETLELIKEAKKQRGGRKPLIRFIPSKLISRAGLSNDLPETLASLGEKVLPGLHQRTVVAEASIEGQTVAEYAKASQARAEFQALAAAIKEMI